MKINVIWLKGTILLSNVYFAPPVSTFKKCIKFYEESAWNLNFYHWLCKPWLKIVIQFMTVLSKSININEVME